MTNMEFTDLVVALDKNYKTFTQSDFEAIQIVYNFYPGIVTKKDIAKVYVSFGMVLINDMFPRAAELSALEDEVRTKRHELEILKDRQKLLTER